MSIPGDPYDACLHELHAHAAESLPARTAWVDCHTHTGWNDPDGYTATAEEILAGLDRAGHARALVFCLQEPGGYPAANDRALFSLVPPGQLLYASDMPYGTAILSSLILLRIGRAVGLDGRALASIAGGQLERLLAGEEPADLGPASGAAIVAGTPGVGVPAP